MSVEVNYKGGVYRFSRNHLGIGNWYIIKGKMPGSLRSSSIGLATPATLAFKLNREAIKLGLVNSGQELLYRTGPEKKEKKKNFRSKKKVVVSKSTKDAEWKKSFNPFKQKENKAASMIDKIIKMGKKKVEKDIR